jgi:hypothetical protein
VSIVIGALGTGGIPVRLTAPWLRRLTALVILASGAVLALPAPAQEPILLTGNWAGTWWIGKYEEPVELDLVQTRMDLAGEITLWAYPDPGLSRTTSTVRAPVTGTVDGHRVLLAWTMPGRGQFSAQLTLLSPNSLHGIGGVEGITTGLGLSRSR